MFRTDWRAGIVAAISLCVASAGFVDAAQAGIVETGAMFQTTRGDDLSAIRAQLAREEVRTQLGRFGVGEEAIEQRLAALSDQELSRLSQRIQEAPAGGDVLAIIGITFIVLLILELVGVIDIFKKVG